MGIALVRSRMACAVQQNNCGAANHRLLSLSPVTTFDPLVALRLNLDNFDRLNNLDIDARRVDLRLPLWRRSYRAGNCRPVPYPVQRLHAACHCIVRNHHLCTINRDHVRGKLTGYSSRVRGKDSHIAVLLIP